MNPTYKLFSAPSFTASSVANIAYNQSLKHLTGNGCEKDESKAFTLCAEAAQHNHHDAVLAMGWHYYGGRGTAVDLSLAEWWYKKSARQGEPRAMFSLGQMAYESNDFATARQWFQRASEKKHARSLYWLAKLYWHGHSVPKDRKEAIALAILAAGQQDPEARRALSLFSRCRKIGRV